MTNLGSLDVVDILKRAWRIFRDDLGDYLKLGIIYVVLALLLGMLANYGHILGIVSVLASGMLTIGGIAVILAKLRGQDLDLGLLRTPIDNFWPCMLAALIITSPWVLAVLILGSLKSLGFIECCVGLIATMPIFFIFLPLVVEGIEPIKALKKSYNYFLTYPLELLLISVPMLVILAASLIFTALFILSIPFLFISSCLVYEEYLRDEASTTATEPEYEEDIMEDAEEDMQ
jgi:hypothetical protein